MACQMPVISSNTGGMPELNLDGVTGFTSNVGDIEDMAEKAYHILKDDQTLNVFKQNALKRASDFDINVILPRYENYYQSVIQNFTVAS